MTETIMDILWDLNEVTEEERNEATVLAKSATCRIHRPFDVRRHIAIFIKYYAVEQGSEATVKAESLRILAEAVYNEAQKIFKMSDEYQARSVNLQHELDELKQEHIPLSFYEKARQEFFKAQEETEQARKELQEAQAATEHMRATRIPNELYTKRLREISKLKEQRAEAETQAFILETENEELKRRIQELSKK